MNKQAASLLLLALCLCSPNMAAADEPIGFRRLRSSLGVGLSVSDWLLGDIGEATSIGVGITIQEAIQYSYFGFGVRLGFGYHLSSQPPSHSMAASTPTTSPPVLALTSPSPTPWN